MGATRFIGAGMQSQSEYAEEFAAGAGDFVEEGAELGGVFLAGPGFDAAGHIHGVGTHDANGFGNIFGREAAGEDDALGWRRVRARDRVNGSTRAAELLGLVSRRARRPAKTRRQSGNA